MIEKKEILKMVDHVIHPHKKEFSDNQIMHPEREWLIGLVISTLVVISGVWWSVSTYMQYSNVSVEDTDGSGGAPINYKSEFVEAAINNFNQRQEIYDTVRLDMINKYGHNELPLFDKEGEATGEVTNDTSVSDSDIQTQETPSNQGTRADVVEDTGS
ncbi:MAG: hypothetical protein H6779_02415 [Candidatus Nomurabacteria bacterium]|nr:hypothetical protein [Candidatus Nomurabacteria bacterium]USN88276.1 MAG: hypothetical protein H6779_02415 [Candidatus Nomurabacteria bacterium]